MTEAVTTRGRSGAGRSRASRPTGPKGRGPRARKSPLLLVVMIVITVYSLLPLFYLVVNATKSQDDLLSTFGLWFGGGFRSSRTSARR